jgi:hypothetical protein
VRSRKWRRIGDTHEDVARSPAVGGFGGGPHRAGERRIGEQGEHQGGAKSYSGKVDEAEGGVLTALGAYKTSKEPAPVETALGKSVTVLKALKAKIAKQSAPSIKVKTAKTKLLKGVGAVIVAYEHLGTAFSDHATNKSAAESEAKTALLKVKSGQKELKEAAKLLS